MSAAVEHFAAEHARLAGVLPGAGHPRIDALRGDALARFAREGLPVTRQEDWKYTSLGQLERHPLAVSDPDETALPALDAVLSRALLPAAAHRLVFVDGHFAAALSRHGLPVAVRAGSLASRIADHPQAGLPLAADDGSALAALNLAFSADGLDLAVPAGIRIDEPILVLFVSVTPDRSAFPASCIHLAPGAQACVVEQHLALHAGAALNTVLERITLDAGATLHHIKVQHENTRTVHLADTAASVASGARLHSLVLALGGQLAREDLRVTLAAAHAEVVLDGLYLARGRSHLDHHTLVLHASPDCTSRQAYRGILDDAGRGVFNGRVVVARDAQRTDAEQSNANLLLSDNAEIDTKPQLEIFADDVKCSHGATVGQLDPAELFYLRSRGLDAATARSLVMFAFAARSLASVDAGSALYAALRALLFTHLPGGAMLEALTQ